MLEEIFKNSSELFSPTVTRSGFPTLCFEWNETRMRIQEAVKKATEIFRDDILRESFIKSYKLIAHLLPKACKRIISDG